jgi:hypothetical protein
MEERIPFCIGDFLELNSDRFDLGVRLTGICREIRGCVLIFDAHDDLELYFRRKFLRKTLPVWHGLMRESHSNQPLIDLWRQALTLRDKNNLDQSTHIEIARSSLNLSAGGIRTELQLPVRLNEYCLLSLYLDDDQPIICALCEIIWVQPGKSDSTRLCGLRFSNLLETDLKRINRFVIESCHFDRSVK